jgi:hypothetical protein
VDGYYVGEKVVVEGGENIRMHTHTYIQMIRLFRTLLLLATFISATSAVVFEAQFVPIITLILSTCGGVLDILDKVFVGGTDPTQVCCFAFSLTHVIYLGTSATTELRFETKK